MFYIREFIRVRYRLFHTRIYGGGIEGLVQSTWPCQNLLILLLQGTVQSNEAFILAIALQDIRNYLLSKKITMEYGLKSQYKLETAQALTWFGNMTAMETANSLSQN